jgi:hypothetical protein
MRRGRARNRPLSLVHQSFARSSCSTASFPGSPGMSGSWRSQRIPPSRCSSGRGCAPSSRGTLDEFFMFRVAGLLEQVEAGVPVTSPDAQTPQQTLTEISRARAQELDELAERFEREVSPLLTRFAVGPGQPFPYISGLSPSLSIFVRDPDSGEERSPASKCRSCCRGSSRSAGEGFSCRSSASSATSSAGSFRKWRSPPKQRNRTA